MESLQLLHKDIVERISKIETELKVRAEDLNRANVSFRLTRLEAEVRSKFEQMDKALELAREGVENGRVEFKDALNYRLQGMNSDTFATKIELRSEVKSIRETLASKVDDLRQDITRETKSIAKDITTNSKFIYYGVGAFIAFEVLSRFVKF